MQCLCVYTTVIRITSESVAKSALFSFSAGGQFSWKGPLKEEERTIIILESPNRILRTLKDINEYLGNRYVVIARELTKVYEEVIRGNVIDLIDKIEKKPLKGEIVLLIKSKKEEEE